ncbi:hypothetical protein ENSA5_65370 [Enhygromyxa salina]|uniref:Uncharacterized protein n=1 Tax=Enhygromyxa salina TaxID=215803 RepID=A0A2S9XC13_9BACT|nr:hypothetical protein [Enhygromyxa salina]PRP90340.1 hypothetical protein ENSA5_65370 [Enhygromyxa salina]
MVPTVTTVASTVVTVETVGAAQVTVTQVFIAAGAGTCVRSDR